MINVDTMRFVDRYAGLPLCWCLSLLRLLSRLAGRTKLPAPRKIPVIKLSEMGSTVLAYPAIEMLKRRIPGLELRFLTFGSHDAAGEGLRGAAAASSPRRHRHHQPHGFLQPVWCGHGVPGVPRKPDRLSPFHKRRVGARKAAHAPGGLFAARAHGRV